MHIAIITHLTALDQKKPRHSAGATRLESSANINCARLVKELAPALVWTGD
jgi:hypothetical protein